jgi:hypothetical protein
VVSGRVGFGSIINGYYIAQPKVREAGLPTYRSTERDADKRHTYMFYHGGNSAWAIAHEVGVDEIIAYALGVHVRPNLVMTDWTVVNDDGTFMPDPAVQCGKRCHAVAPYSSLPTDDSLPHCSLLTSAALQPTGAHLHSEQAGAEGSLTSLGPHLLDCCPMCV